MYMLKRYREAVDAIREGLQRAPHIVFGFVWYAAALIRLGERAQAKKAIDVALRLAPRISVKNWPMFSCYRNADDASHMVDAVREAGFP